jgi:TetR/AcrR family transcriptional regulator
MVSARATDSEIPKAIVAAASRLFAAQGFEATSLQAVADAVGVTKQAVLHHYASKEHLRQAVLDAIVAHWNEALPRLLLAATASDDRFEAVFGELHRFFATDPDRARVLVREALDRPAEIKKLLRGPVQPWLSAVARYIRAGQESGRHFPDVDPEAYVVHVMQLGITAAASMPVASSALLGDAGERYDRELARIARASLFAPRPPQGAGRKGSAPKKR